MVMWLCRRGDQLAQARWLGREAASLEMPPDGSRHPLDHVGEVGRPDRRPGG